MCSLSYFYTFQQASTPSILTLPAPAMSLYAILGRFFQQLGNFLIGNIEENAVVLVEEDIEEPVVGVLPVRRGQRFDLHIGPIRLCLSRFEF